MAKQWAGEHWLLSKEALLKSKHRMACHLFPMVCNIYRMATRNLPACGKMLSTSSKSGNQVEQHVLWPYFPEKAEHS